MFLFWLFDDEVVMAWKCYWVKTYPPGKTRGVGALKLLYLRPPCLVWISWKLAVRLSSLRIGIPSHNQQRAQFLLNSSWSTVVFPGGGGSTKQHHKRHNEHCDPPREPILNHFQSKNILLTNSRHTTDAKILASHFFVTLLITPYTLLPHRIGTDFSTTEQAPIQKSFCGTISTSSKCPENKD